MDASNAPARILLALFVTVLGLAAAGCDGVVVPASRIGLEAPVLLAPRSGQVVVAGEASGLQWEEVDGASGYEVELARGADASVILVRTVTPDAVVVFERAGSVTWRARGLDVEGRAGYWSRPWRLTVEEAR